MIIEHEGKPARVPDFLVAGAPRCGTTTVDAGLRRNPRAFLPSVKEPMFFTAGGRPPFIDARTGRPIPYFLRDARAYLRLFADAGEERRAGECSSFYLYDHAHSIPAIRRLYGGRASGLRIVLLLRDPARRAWSHYLQKRRNGEERLPFAEATRPEVVRERLAGGYWLGFDYLGIGLYHDQVRAFLEAFPRVLVLIHEEVTRDLVAAMESIFRFLDAVPDRPVGAPGPHLNAAGRPRNAAARLAERAVFRPFAVKSLLKRLVPNRAREYAKHRIAARLYRPEPIPGDQRERLRDAFREDVRRLESLLGRPAGSLWSAS